MSAHDDFDESAARRTNNAPYSTRHPVPTVQGYQGHKEARKAETVAQIPNNAVRDHQGGESKGLLQSTKRFLHIGEPPKDEAVDEDHPYESANRNVEAPVDNNDTATNDHRDDMEKGESGGADHAVEKASLEDTSEAIDSTLNPKQKRKNMKHMKRDHATREVTDPVTHLRVTIHDTTNKELSTVPENEPPPNSMPRNSTGLSMGSKNQAELDKETDEQQVEHDGMEKLFPPPSFDATREEMTGIYTLAFTVGLCAILLSTIFIPIGILLVFRFAGAPRSSLTMTMLSILFIVTILAAGGGTIWFLQGWLKKKLNGVWDDELWTAAREQEKQTTHSPMPESTQWLNSLLSSVWSLINPDLFTSLADTLEDVMQASLPKLVRMISVEDLGQGNESIRILGVRWLPTGAAAKNVSEDGKVKSDKNQQNDRKVPGEGEVGEDAKSDDAGENSSAHEGEPSESDKKEAGEDQNVAEGMEAEEGDFVNVEVAFSYRASKSGKSIKTKSKNAHLYLAFYLPGSIRVRKLGLPKCIILVLVLTISSCMGGTSRDCGNDAHASPALP